MRIKHIQSKSGFPIKTWAAIAIIAIWNLFFLYDFMNLTDGIPVGKGGQFALEFIFVTGLLLLISEPFRLLILKEGRTLDDIKKFVIFLMLISGLMFLQLAFMS